MKLKHLQGVVSGMIEDLLSFRVREAEGVRRKELEVRSKELMANRDEWEDREAEGVRGYGGKSAPGGTA